MLTNTDTTSTARSLEGQRSSRAFPSKGLDEEGPASFSNYEELEDDVASNARQIQFDFIADDAPLEGVSYDEEQEEEDAMFESVENVDADAPIDDVDAPIDDELDEDADFETSQVTLESKIDNDKDGSEDNAEDSFEIDLTPTFSLQGNFSEIVGSITKRYGEPVNDVEKQKLSMAIESMPQNVVVAEERVGLQPFARSRGFDRAIFEQASQRRITVNGEEVIFARSEFQVRT